MWPRVSRGTVKKSRVRQSELYLFVFRDGSTLGQGARAPYPQIDLLPPQIQKLADRSDVISEVSKCSKIQIFWGWGV